MDGKNINATIKAKITPINDPPKDKSKEVNLFKTLDPSNGGTGIKLKRPNIIFI